LRKKIVTELAVLLTPKGFKLVERARVTVEHIIASTEAELIIGTGNGY
jgi:acyl CoA:acetate/3-ketoacid CoA transferase beta subunit